MPEGEQLVVVAGEALIDLVPGDHGALRGHPGGGPFNAARTLARLERPVAYLGRLSCDRFGRDLRAALAADGVRLDTVVDTEDPTTLALAEVDARGSALYRFYVEGTSAPGLTLEDARARLPETPAVLFVGTLGLVLEPMAATYEALVAEADDATLVFLDPNVRPSVIADAAAYRARLDRVLGRADVVKASVEDLEWLEPTATAEEAARTLLARGPVVALVTTGGDGALVVTANRAEPVAGARADVVDTIGAGDAFGGGFLAWWTRAGLGRVDLADLGHVVDATRYACAVAARTCERAGADPPRADEV